MAKNESKFMSLNKRDLLRSLVLAILTPAVYVIQKSLDAGSLQMNWKEIAIAAVSGAVAYLIKNFLTAPKENGNDTE